MKNNFLTEFNTGGSHQQNPLGGIPQGIGANGQPNTVEEGETKSKDYVFSDRLKLDDKLIARYALPKNLKGKTMAEASKKLNESFKETNSKIDRETTEEMIGRLTEASEEARISEELATMPDVNKKQLGGMLKHQNQMFFGGLFNTGQNQQSQHISGINPETEQGINGVKDVASNVPIVGMFRGIGEGVQGMAEGVAGKDSMTASAISGLTDPFSNQIGTLQNEEATTGEKIMSIISPELSGIIGKRAKDERQSKKERTFDLSQNAQYRNTFEDGGFLNHNKDKNKPRVKAKSVVDPDLNKAVIQNYNKQGAADQFIYNDRLFDNKIANTFANTSETVDSLEGNFEGINPGKYANLDYFELGNLNNGRQEINPGKGYKQSHANFGSVVENLKKVNPNTDFIYKQKQYAYGGDINYQPNGIGLSQLADYSLGKIPLTTTGPQSSLPENGLLDAYYSQQERPDVGTYAKIGLNQAGDFLGENYGEIMRYAPVATNALQLANLKKPEQESLDRLDSRYQPDYVDERQLVNRASSEYNNVANSLKSATNGSVGALRSNLLAAHLNRTKGLSDSFLQANNMNREENRFGQQFNNQNDRVNLNQSNTEKDWNARNRAAYDNEKSKFISKIGDDIGNIGLEQMRKKYPERMGLYYDNKGNFIG